MWSVREDIAKETTSVKVLDVLVEDEDLNVCVVVAGPDGAGGRAGKACRGWGSGCARERLQKDKYMEVRAAGSGSIV